MRQSCPHPYADADDNVEIVCEASPWVTQVRGIVFKHHIENLLPYTNYQYQLNAFNEAGGLVAPPVVTVPTSTARKLSSHMSSCHGLHMSRYYVILAVNMASVADTALSHHPLTHLSKGMVQHCKVFLWHLVSCSSRVQQGVPAPYHPDRERAHHRLVQLIRNQRRSSWIHATQGPSCGVQWVQDHTQGVQGFQV